MDRPEEFDRELEAHYRKYYKTLVSMMSKGKKRPIAEDIVQEAYTRALEQWETYDPNTSEFATWFGSKLIPQAAQNLIRAEYRSGMASAIEALDETSIDAEMVNIPADADTKVKVHEILRRISKKEVHERSILNAVLVLGMSYDEAIGYSGVSNTAARKLVERFKQEMQHEDRVS